jgi:ribosomal protein L7/L12
METMLDALTRHTLVRPAEAQTKDFIELDKLSRAEQETRLLELAESGDKLGAIALARRLYGYDLSQAKDFIEGLARKMN